MNQEHDYVNYFYEKYEGRVAIGVGYDRNLSEIYPFVFEDTDGKSIGVVALGVYTHESINYVHIYHIGSFTSNRGNGSQILQELCFQADKHQIILSLSPILIS
jgi:N-acetylglutamate synthase-like GNAT family acetyltransferase